jgi:hypothetical protein
VSPADLAALGSARASTMVATITKGGTIEAARIKVVEPSAVKRSKAGSSRVSSEMTMTAGDQD